MTCYEILLSLRRWESEKGNLSFVFFSRNQFIIFLYRERWISWDPLNLLIGEMQNSSDDASSENGFELVDKPSTSKDSSNSSSMTEPTPLPAWINPPTNLPINLMSGPPPLLLPAGQLFPTTSTPTTGTQQFFTNLSAVGSHSQPVSVIAFLLVVVVLLHLVFLI